MATLTNPRHLLFIPVLAVLSACVSMDLREPYPRRPASPRWETHPGPYRTEPGAPTETPAPPGSGRGAEPGASVATPPAVAALMNEATDSVNQGELENAATAMERAIRIQPRNPLLWQRLAEIRLRQQQPGLAEDLAKRSNLHARGDVTLTRRNWSIIAEARRLKGDVQGADEAARKAGD